VLPNDELRCGGGASGILVSSTARDAGIAGLEFLRGIPGTVGGFVRMNGGAYGREVADILVDCDVAMPDGQLVRLAASELRYSYRHSALPDGAIGPARRPPRAGRRIPVWCSHDAAITRRRAA